MVIQVLEMDWLFHVALMALPMYVTNSMAMVFGGGQRLDFNKNCSDGRPLLGKSKTLRGTFFGIMLGMVCVLAIWLLFPQYTILLTDNYLFYGLMLCLGAIIGDAVASFFKRRLNFSPGREVLLLDQLDFIIGGLIFTAYIYLPTFFELAVLAVATLIVHKLSNFLAFKIKLKRVPW
jgi:CDP-2,3-bis-(O-geranylgeranyl)-sn-glycerol synthase